MHRVRAGVSRTWAVVAVLVIALTPNLAMAGSIAGDTVDIEYLYPTSSTLFGLGTTGVVTSSGLTLNVQGTTLWTVFPDHVDMNSIYPAGAAFLSAAFNGVSVTDLTHPGAFTSASADPASTVVGVTNSNVSIQSGVLFINYQGLEAPFGSLARVDFSAATVPEPSTLLLLGSALAALVAARKKIA